MNTLLLVSTIVSWVAVLFLAFLVVGALRALALFRWRLDQLEVTTPTRKGRGGLKVGTKAPAFTLASVAGGNVSLSDYGSRKVFLVFVQTTCKPCHDVVPHLNRLQRDGPCQVLVVNNGEPEAVAKWTAEVQAAFPVLVQERWAVSKRYEVFATPFAFLIDEQGLIVSKGLVSNKQHIGFVLERRHSDPAKLAHGEGEVGGADAAGTEDSHSVSSPKEVAHV
jgi:methylamine dehydrogenase accessory protein MauD